MSITLCITAKDEESCIHLPISSVENIVNEIIVVDDFSTDKTARIAASLGAKVIKYNEPISDIGFGAAANRTISNATMDWILILDADEMLSSPHMLYDLMRYQSVFTWALPRRKWLDYSKNQRMEFESYPDWQPKFFRNVPENKFEGEMHIRFVGHSPRRAYRGPHIEHLQLENRTPEKIRHRDKLYAKLAAIQGVEVEKGNKRRM
jgi:glycosyltransferase involved in cell wall biosynthesis